MNVSSVLQEKLHLQVQQNLQNVSVAVVTRLVVAVAYQVAVEQEEKARKDLS